MTVFDTQQSAFQDLEPALIRLDILIRRAINIARQQFDSDIGADAYRGLYISEDDVDRLLRAEPGTPTFSGDAGSANGVWKALPDGSPLAWLQAAYGLTGFDLDVILIALAPEIDLRYERLYAYLQDDVSRRQASVDLALNLLCESVHEKIERRMHFLPGSPLIDDQLVTISPSPGSPHHLAATIQLDQQIVNLLLGQEALDSRLSSWSTISMPDRPSLPLTLEPAELDNLVDSLKITLLDGQPARVLLTGLHEADRRALAEQIAATLDAPLLSAKLDTLEWNGDHNLANILVREAWLQDAVLFISGIDAALDSNQTRLVASVLESLSDASCLVLVSTESPSHVILLDSQVVWLRLELPPATAALRRECWVSSLADQDDAVSGRSLDTLAARFRLSPSQISAIVESALTATAGASDLQQFTDQLFASARAWSGSRIASLTQKIEPVATWDDIVLPADTLAQLWELCAWAVQRDRVLDDWEFGAKLSRGKGAAALFAGPSGTGKTMAAEIIAHELQLDLYRIDLASVVSKYIGETEKNLDQIFNAARDASAILFFDEADSLFGKRSEVRDSHDRYANIEISYLLQKMEEHDGITILATNLRQNLDDAFVRRLAFTIHFPFPDESDRWRIWTRIWPDALPIANDVDFERLASLFRLSGGNIKNIALSAAYLAAADDQSVQATHIAHAVRREYQKLGKTLSDEELRAVVAEAEV